MNIEMKKSGKNTSSHKSIIPFLEAPDWKQDRAKAREDLLLLFDKWKRTHNGLSKKELVKGFLRAFNRGLIGGDIKKNLKKTKEGKVSRTTLYRWQEIYTKSGISALLPEDYNIGCRINPVIQEAINKLVWQNHLCRIQDIMDDLGVLFPKAKLPHYTTIRRYVKAYKEEHWILLVQEHEGEKGLRDRGMNAVIGRADGNLTEPNQRWEIDTTVGDLFIRLLTKQKVKNVTFKMKDGKRYKMIGIIDVFSRMAKWYFVEKENSDAVILCIKDRIRVWGRPKEIACDNGMAYIAKRIKRGLRNIGIYLNVLLPGHPELKPYAERAFRTVGEKLFRRLVGYSGSLRQGTRPSEIEIKHIPEEAGKILDEWTENVYAETIHRSTGQRPRERMRPPGFVPEVIDERELDILLMDEHVRVVRQGHVTYQGGRYFHPKLINEGQKVTIRVNNFEASEVLVFFNGKFLCIAEDYQRKGKSVEEILEAKKERTKELRTRLRAHESLIDKGRPKDQNMLDFIAHHKKLKPAELPGKAELLVFPGLRNIPYTKDGMKTVGDIEPEECVELGEVTGLIRTRQERYLYLMGKKGKGESLDKDDEEFLHEFELSDEYQLVKSYLKKKLAGGF
jgi:transposase InsO family protein